MIACTQESEFSGVIESIRELCVSIVECQMLLTRPLPAWSAIEQGWRVNRRWIAAGLDNQSAANPFLLAWASSGESTNPPTKDQKYE